MRICPTTPTTHYVAQDNRLALRIISGCRRGVEPPECRRVYCELAAEWRVAKMDSSICSVSWVIGITVRRLRPPGRGMIGHFWEIGGAIVPRHHATRQSLPQAKCSIALVAVGARLKSQRTHGMPLSRSVSSPADAGA